MVDGRNNCDGGSHARDAGEAELSPDLFGAFTHAEQTEMAGLRLNGRVCHETISIIADGQLDSAGSVAKVKLDIPGGGVFDRVGSGFLSDAQQMILETAGESLFLA